MFSALFVAISVIVALTAAQTTSPTWSIKPRKSIGLKEDESDADFPGAKFHSFVSVCTTILTRKEQNDIGISSVGSRDRHRISKRLILKFKSSIRI